MGLLRCVGQQDCDGQPSFAHALGQQVWDYTTGQLKLDLAYQVSEQFMMHDTAVLALAFTSDSELLASGSQDGKVKVWRLRTGQCLRRFEKAHTQGVTSLAFSLDGTHVLSGGFDGLVRYVVDIAVKTMWLVGDMRSTHVHVWSPYTPCCTRVCARVYGMKSGKMLKEFRGHASYVNHVAYTADGNQVLSASSDGTVRVWNAKTCECVHAFRYVACLVSFAFTVCTAHQRPLEPPMCRSTE